MAVAFVFLSESQICGVSEGIPATVYLPTIAHIQLHPDFRSVTGRSEQPPPLPPELKVSKFNPLPCVMFTKCSGTGRQMLGSIYSGSFR